MTHAGTTPQHARDAIAWALALLLHFALWRLAMHRPLPESAVPPDFVPVEIVKVPPTPSGPEPQAVPPAREQAAAEPVPGPDEPVDLHTPPPTQAAPDDEARTEAVPVFGLSSNSPGASGGFRVRSGNTVAIRPQDSAITDTIRPLPTAELTRYPSIARRADAVYPPELRRSGIEGDIVLELVVAADGTVTSARIVESSDPRFDDAALNAARHTRFRPAERNGVPVAARIRFPVRFRLR